MNTKIVNDNDINNMLDFAYEMNQEIDRPTLEKWITDYFCRAVYNSYGDITGIIIYDVVLTSAKIIFLACNKNQIIKRLLEQVAETATDVIINVDEIDLERQISMKDLGMKCIKIKKENDKTYYVFYKTLPEWEVVCK